MTYNPMSKEFQDECKRLGLTGYQLTIKYKKEGKFLEKGIYKDGRSNCRPDRCYTEKQLLESLLQFYKIEGRIPTITDFINNPIYPGHATYRNHFGSWSNALRLVGLDADSMVKRGILETNNQKARIGEIIIRDHFTNNPIDLAGKNQNSYCDGICPNGMNYDVKSSKYDGTKYAFSTENKCKDRIDIYYFLAFNEDWTILEYAWRVPGEIVDSSSFYIGNGKNGGKCIENMKQYDITDKLNTVLIKYGLR